MKRRWILALSAIALASFSAQAFSDFANIRFADDIVREVWSERDRETCVGHVKLSDQLDYCRLLEGDRRDICMNLSDVLHPAQLPNAIGDSDLEHPGECPIVSYPERNHICASRYEALDEARLWLNMSRYAKSKCERIYFFAVASNYLSQTFNPFNFVLGEDEQCKNILYRRLDDSLKYNRTVYGFEQTCAFRYMQNGERKTYLHPISVNHGDINRLMRNLTAEVIPFYAMPFAEKKENESVPDFGCETDSDCIMVDADCCGCTGGGKQKAMSKLMAEDWRDNLERDCADAGCMAVMSQHVSCYSDPVCVGGECSFEPDPQRICQNNNIRVDCEQGIDIEKEYGIGCGEVEKLCGWDIMENIQTTTTATTMIRPQTSVTVTTMALPSTTMALSTTTILEATKTTLPDGGVETEQIQKNEGGTWWSAYLAAVFLAIAAAFFILKGPAPKPESKRLRGLGDKGARKSRPGSQGTKLGDAGRR